MFRDRYLLKSIEEGASVDSSFVDDSSTVKELVSVEMFSATSPEAAVEPAASDVSPPDGAAVVAASDGAAEPDASEAAVEAAASDVTSPDGAAVVAAPEGAVEPAASEVAVDPAASDVTSPD